MSVWTRRGLRAAGWDDARLMRAVRRGTLLHVGYDRYAEPGPLPLERLAAPAGSNTALSGLSSARARGLPVASAAVSVVVPPGCRRPMLPPAVAVREKQSWVAEEIDGVLLTPLGDTLIEVARTEPLEVSVPILDAGLRQLGGPPRPVPRRTGNRRVRRALALADARAESPLESLLRLTLVLGGLPPDDLQHVVREHGRFVARVDLWYPGVVVEADGFEFHSGRAEYRRDRRKGQAFGRLGLLVLRFSWEDVMGAPDHVVATVRAAVAASSTLAGGAEEAVRTHRRPRATATRQRSRRAAA